MRYFALGACAFVFGWAACSPTEEFPPGLPDFDGASHPSPGNGGNPDGGTDAATDGGSISVLAGAANPKGIYLAAGYVYYTNFATGANDGSISTIATTGGTGADLATGLTAPWALTVSSGFVFFTGAPTTGTGSVSAVATTGGTVTPIQTGATGAVGIVNDGTNLYWTIDTGSGVSIETVPIIGGTGKDILDLGGDVSPTALALSATSLFIGTKGTQAALLTGLTTGSGNLTELDTPTSVTMGDVAVSTTTIYVTIDDATPNGAIIAYPRGSGSPQTIASSLNHPQRLALDGTNLYFTDPIGGNVWVVDLTTNQSAIYASGFNAPLPIAVADALYVGDADAIVRIPKL